MVGLVSERGAVFVGLIKGLGDIDDRLFVQRDSVTIHGPIAAVHLNVHIHKTQQ